MPNLLNKFSIPTALTVGLTALVISACGGDSGDSGATELAKFAPADTPVFIEGALQPDEEAAASINSISEKVAGVNLGELIVDGINSSGEVDFEADLEPWLGETAAAIVQFDPEDIGLPDSGPSFDTLDDLAEGDDLGADSLVDTGEDFTLVVETTDTDAAQAFIDEQAESDSTEGEYEGFSYKSSGNDSVAGIVDDHVVVASSEDEFKAVVDASEGNNLADADSFTELSDKVSDDALASIFISNDPYINAMGGGELDFSGLYSALGIELEGTGTVLSLVPNENEISLQGYSNAGSDMTSGDPTALIETFPEDSLFATGSGDVGANTAKIIEALDTEGIPGVIEPGQVGQFIDQASGQIDVRGIVESLETVGFFVSGSTPDTLGGALVVTSSDIQPIESSLRGISSLFGLAGDASLRPLPDGIAGFAVRTPDLPGRPVVVGVKDDRLVIGIGMEPSLQALNASGPSLVDNEAFKAADSSTEEDGLDMFASPAAIAELIVSGTAGDPAAQQIADVLAKFEYLAAGSSEADGTFEFNLGLGE